MTDDRARELAAAERRLSRRLKGGERHVQWEKNSRTIDAAKASVHEAIEQEKRRVLGLMARGHASGVKLKVTPAMTAALADLYEAGQAAAIAELEAHGVKPQRSYARRSTKARISHVLTKLRGFLGGITIRARREHASAELGSLTGRAIVDALDRRVPGALDAASRLVSGTFADGLASVYEEHPDAFDAGWIYSAAGDAAMCDECASHDGEEFETLEAAYEVLPDFGPNPDCDGEDRCRCRLVPA